MTWSDEPRPVPDAGWYPDPGGTGGLRYWDGRTWTGHLTEPRPPAAPLAPSRPPGPTPPPPPAPSSKTPVWVWVALAGTLALFGIGVLAAVAVPVFHVARDSVWDDEAQANLQDAYAAATQIRATSGSYLAVTPERLAGMEPRLRYTTVESTSAEQVSVYALDQQITVAVRSRSGTCWVIDDGATFRTGRIGGDAPSCSAAVGGAGLVLDDF